MTDNPAAARYLSLLRLPADAPALEAAGGARADVPDKRELLGRLEDEIEYLQWKTGLQADPDGVVTLLSQADVGLSHLLDDGLSARLGPAEISGLEAVIRTDGSRPVLFVEDDFVDLMAPSAAYFAAGLSRLEDAVRQTCRSVGRVEDPSAILGYQGTAWMLGDGLVATNYHVLKAIAPGCSRAGTRFQGQLKTGAAVHFGHELGNRLPERRFPIRRVVGVGREGAAQFCQGNGVNFDGLDLAILELEPVARRSFPKPMPVARGDDRMSHGEQAAAGRGVYLVGYPGNEKSTTTDLFASLFAGVKSVKRLAPGRIMAGAGQMPEDHRGWILTHDASTLGGSSGSAVVDYEGDGQTVLGLHFGGSPGWQNCAHSLERITAELSGVLPRGAS